MNALIAGYRKKTISLRQFSDLLGYIPDQEIEKYITKCPEIVLLSYYTGSTRYDSLTFSPENYAVLQFNNIRSSTDEKELFLAIYKFIAASEAPFDMLCMNALANLAGRHRNDVLQILVDPKYRAELKEFPQYNILLAYLLPYHHEVFNYTNLPEFVDALYRTEMVDHIRRGLLNIRDDHRDEIIRQGIEAPHKLGMITWMSRTAILSHVRTQEHVITALCFYDLEVLRLECGENKDLSFRFGGNIIRLVNGIRVYSMVTRNHIRYLSKLRILLSKCEPLPIIERYIEYMEGKLEH